MTALAFLNYARKSDRESFNEVVDSTTTKIKALMNYEFKKIRTTDFSQIKLVKMQPRLLKGRLKPYLQPEFELQVRNTRVVP